MRNTAVLGLTLATSLVVATAAFAGPGPGPVGQPPGNRCFILCSPPGGHPAPAPLLAAGLPAFAALGGGLFVSRLFRRRAAQS